MNIDHFALPGFGPSFSLFSIVFVIIFAAALFIIGTVAVRLIKQKRNDDRSPRLDVDARVVAKRTHVSGDHAHTSYYVTFQVNSGDRMELHVPSYDYGMLVEGDQGKLTFQGSRFLGFTR